MYFSVIIKSIAIWCLEEAAGSEDLCMNIFIIPSAMRDRRNIQSVVLSNVTINENKHNIKTV
jgi:hypothetical protein